VILIAPNPEKKFNHLPHSQQQPAALHRAAAVAESQPAARDVESGRARGIV